MRGFFHPRSVAVFGVSESATNLARGIAYNLFTFGFQGPIHLIGARPGEFFGRPILPSLDAVEGEVDLAVILTPAPTVPGILEACGRRGIRRAVIETGGFAELGEQGRRLSEQLKSIARQSGMRFVGPNGVGSMNFVNGMVLPFPPLTPGLKTGTISIIAQSGGVGLGYVGLLADAHLGVGKAVSVGNKLDVDECDLLEYFLEDPETSAVVMYLESLSDGPRFMDLARGATKPILVHKSNIGRLSHGIAASHTAALVGDDAVADAAFRQVGVVRFADDASLLRHLSVLTLPRPKGPGVAILSRSGGHAVIAADACERHGFDLPAFPAEFIAGVQQHYRAKVIKLGNPLDLGDLFDFPLYGDIARQALELPDVDALVFIHTYVAALESAISDQLFTKLTDLAATSDKPMVICAAVEKAEERRLRELHPLAIFTDPADPLKALAILRDWPRPAETVRPGVPAPPAGAEAIRRRVLGDARAAGRDPLLPEALALLGAYGVPVGPGEAVASAAEARSAAARLGVPAALKLVSARYSHKTDVGGVRLDLAAPEAVAAAYVDLAERPGPDAPGEPLRALVQPMARPGVDLLLGGRRDPTFGPVVVVGAGGIYAEILRSVSRRVAPLSRREAEAMIDELPLARILRGARGQAASDVDAVVEAILGLARLLIDAPEIAEVDVNPLRVHAVGKGATALDARLILASP